MPYGFDKVSVKTLLADFQKAWNSHDADALAPLLEEELIVVVDADGTHHKGAHKAREFLIERSQKHALHFVKCGFQAFHPDIVLAEISWHGEGERERGEVCLVATCGPDAWQIEWVRFLP